MLLKVLIAILSLSLLLVVFVVVKVQRAFRNLSAKRLDVYATHLGELHQAMHNLKHGHERNPFDPDLGGQFVLIASFPTMRKSSETIEALTAYHRKLRDKAHFSEIAAAAEAAEEKLVEMNVAMRDDLALNTGNGRFPNAEVFRSHRDKP